MELYYLESFLVLEGRKPGFKLGAAAVVPPTTLFRTNNCTAVVCCCSGACASTADMSMSGFPMSRGAEIAGLVIAATFFVKACKAFATTSAATGAVSRGKNSVPEEL